MSSKNGDSTDSPSHAKSGDPMFRKVFVSGCYDILHAGHLQFFREARALGNHLTVSFASAEVLFDHKQKKPSIPDEHKQLLISALDMVDECVVGTNSDTLGLDFIDAFIRVKPHILAVTSDDKYEIVKKKLCAQHGAEYVVLPKTEPQAKPISTTSILANIRAPQRVPLRVDFGGGWLDVPRHARTGAYIVNCSISPLVSLDEWEYEKSGGLGGSGAHALLCGKDGVRSEVEELGVGWQDPAVIAETGLCVWRSGKRPELAFKTDAAMLEGRMILFWTGIQHDTPAQADKARNYRIIEAAGSLASQGVRSDSLSLLTEGVKLSYIAQRGEGMPQLDFPDSEGNADFSRVRYDLDQSLKEESVSNSNGYHNGKISTESIPRKSPDSTVGRAVTSVIGSGASAPHASPGEGQDFCEQLMPPGVLACKYCGGGWGGYAVLICDSTNARDKLAAACPAQYRVIEPFIKFRC